MLRGQGTGWAEVNMRNFERAVAKMQERVGRMPPPEVRQAESAAVRPGPERPRYARALLQNARESGAISADDSRAIEYVLETWDDRGLAAELAAMAWIDVLSDSRSWRQGAA